MAAVELTDVDSVRQFMQKSVSDKLQDEDIEVLILGVSDAFPRHCNREFGPTGTETTRSFEFEPNGNGFEVVDLKPYEYRALHGVTLDPDFAPGTILVANQYREWSFPARDGTFFGLRLVNLEELVTPKGMQPTAGLPFRTRRVDVKADWGMASVPEEIRHWANVTVEAWSHLRREGGAPNMTEFGEGPLPPGYDLPLPVVWGLKRWVRPTPSA
jgi:hypothetical protein